VNPNWKGIHGVERIAHNQGLTQCRFPTECIPFDENSMLSDLGIQVNVFNGMQGGFEFTIDVKFIQVDATNLSRKHGMTMKLFKWLEVPKSWVRFQTPSC